MLSPGFANAAGYCHNAVSSEGLTFLPLQGSTRFKGGIKQ
jgi:hypothetical protein